MVHCVPREWRGHFVGRTGETLKRRRRSVSYMGGKNKLNPEAVENRTPVIPLRVIAGVTIYGNNGN